MARLGHSTPRAALIYQHAATDRDKGIAEGLDALVEAAQSVEPTEDAEVQSIGS